MSSVNEKKDIVKILKESSSNNGIPCAKVFEICSKNSFFPDLAGFTMDQNKIKITFCQLGLFGHPEGKKIPVCEHVSEELKTRILSNLEEDRLSCASAWNIASELNIKKTDVSAACEKLGKKISKCQLGAFSEIKKGQCK